MKEIEKTASKITDAFKKASKQANDVVDALMTAEIRAGDGNLEATFAAIREKQLLKDLEVLRAECADLKEENRQLKDSSVQTNNQLRVRDQECIDLKKDRERLRGELADAKKTISKMQQEHEAEVRELNDELMEAKAEANAVRKSKEEALSKYNDAVDTLDSDSVAFGAILDLAHIAQSVSQSLYKVSKRIEAETEGRI